MQKLIGQTWARTLLLVWLTPCLFFAEQVQMPWSWNEKCDDDNAINFHDDCDYELMRMRMMMMMMILMMMMIILIMSMMTLMMLPANAMDVSLQSIQSHLLWLSLGPRLRMMIRRDLATQRTPIGWKCEGGNMKMETWICWGRREGGKEGRREGGKEGRRECQTLSAWPASTSTVSVNLRR